MFKKIKQGFESRQRSPEQSEKEKDWEIAREILNSFFKAIDADMNHTGKHDSAFLVALREAIGRCDLDKIKENMTTILIQKQENTESMRKEAIKQHDELYQIGRSNRHEINALRLINDMSDEKNHLLNQLTELIYHSDVDISSYQLKGTSTEARFKEILENILNDIDEIENDPNISQKPGKLEILGDLKEAKELIEGELNNKE